MIYVEEPFSNFIGKSPFPIVIDFDSSNLSEHKISNEIKKSVTDRISVMLKTGRCSTVLLNQLSIHGSQLYEKFGSECHTYHYQTILETIEAVENNHNTNIRLFKNKPLKGLFHVHHNSNTFSNKNDLNYWKSLIRGKNEITFQNQRLREVFIDLEAKHSTEFAENNSLSILLNNIRLEAMDRKFDKRTGEWIVFAEFNDINYFLCLATHNEATQLGDHVIYERIAPCLEEFPELKYITQNG